MTQNGSFTPNEHLVQIKSKSGKVSDYLPVQWRLVWLRSQARDATIETELVQLDLDRQIAVFKAVVTNGSAIAMGHGSESAKDFADYIEKAETKSIGRALAALGFGTQFVGDDLDEQHRIVDAPVERKAAQPATVKNTLENSPASDQQIREIIRLANALNKNVERPKTYAQANVLLTQLSREYNKAS